MKAIETRHNGFRFRSRLEARWAVFFEDLGMAYQYEPEGFKLDSGTCYLPDFYLPEVGVYAEVKPSTDLPHDDVVTFTEFARTHPLLLLWGSPGQDDILWLFTERDMPCQCEFARSSLTDKLTLTCAASQRSIEHARASAKAARFEHGESGHA